MFVRIWAGVAATFVVSHAIVEAQLSNTLWTSWPPLAVRSPYLSAWLNMIDSSPDPNTIHRWPTFFSNSSGFLGLGGNIRVDNKPDPVYSWSGAGAPNATTVVNLQITPTRTIMTLTAGPVDLNVTFLSPIEPADPVAQSFPVSYISLTAWSNDGQPHAVQVYCDLSGEWLSGTRSQSMDWNATTAGPVIFHEAFLLSPQPFSESSGQAEDATLYFASLKTQQTTWQADTAPSARSQFQDKGILKNSIQPGPAVILEYVAVLSLHAIKL
ncbi:DUF5127 domain-containing protein [Phanerochaete sordida]|uniref:DUF5127 domain-containing protein n=1 Tax=Phanerochaete sordida TaxID=48140 RepID=A0A9P3GHP6_9APHY|nr:DUF5127 domain-containing protein [Phanerochaete sordida]